MVKSTKTWYTPTITARQMATVLAALRYWQADLSDDDTILDGRGFFDEHCPLTVEEVDTLCEHLNLD